LLAAAADAPPGPIDEAELKNIKSMLDIFTNTVEVLEASGGVFRFKYHGLIKNQIGMEAWARDIILENHPSVRLRGCAEESHIIIST